MADEISIAGYTFAANKATVVCKHVAEGDQPVLLYVHEEDGGLQVLCGASDHSVDDGVIICLSHIVDRHADLATLPVVEMGEQAWRDSREQPWTVYKL